MVIVPLFPIACQSIDRDIYYVVIVILKLKGGAGASLKLCEYMRAISSPLSSLIQKGILITLGWSAMKITTSDFNTMILYFSDVRVFTFLLLFAFVAHEEFAEIVKTRSKALHWYILCLKGL
jgi:hypothetical protein